MVDIQINSVGCIMFVLVTVSVVLIFDLVQKSSVAQNIMDWCMRLCQNVSI